VTIVLVTEPEFKRAESVFVSAPGVQCTPAPPGEAELARTITDRAARYVVVGSYAYTSALYSALPRGGVIARFGVGHDSVDKVKATKAGILCTNTPGVLDQSVAEHAMLLMAAAARHLVRNTSDMRGGTWDLGPQGMELRGKTLAVIGWGRIGRATARIAARGFAMRVVGFRRSPAETSADCADVTADFGAAVRDAHFVSLHITAEAGNRKFINAERLALLSPYAWLINTARGAVVDEVALYDALAARRLAGAALDVFEREPYVPGEASRDFRTLENVILTPHVGSHTVEANRLMAQRALENIRLAEARNFAGMDLLNPKVLEGPGSDPGLTPV
jgi:phosphoglycerate dehydrogenase-like enzyme